MTPTPIVIEWRDGIPILTAYWSDTFGWIYVRCVR